jgi:hypothetical protein
MAGLPVPPLKAYGTRLALLRIGVWYQKPLPYDSAETMYWRSAGKVNRDLWEFLRYVHGSLQESRN